MNQRTDEQGKGEAFRLLFVCTGNTCRSPLAEALLRREAERRGWSHVEARSAGVAAFPGTPASGGALRVAHEEGLPLDAHRARPLTEGEVEWADLILAMSPAHLHAAEERGGGGKVALLTAFAAGSENEPSLGPAVSDPIGGDHALYRATFREIEELVEKVLRRLEPIVAP